MNGLQAAIHLEPANALYQEQLGRVFSITGDWNAAARAYQTAASLNPYKASAWFNLASVYQVSGNLPDQEKALEQAIRADPRTPDVAWEAANFYLAQGEVDKAFREFRLAIEGDATKADAALRLCLRVNPDIDAVMQRVLPSRAIGYISLLSLLEARHDTQGAFKAWAALMGTQQSFEIRYLFEYLKYLLVQHEVDAAQSAWKEAAGKFGLSAYLPTPENLIVNPDFSADILNEPFDWQYNRQSGLALTLDSTDFHAGRRSLSITFEGPGISDAGISQVIPVKPERKYDFSAFYKAPDIQGAGGPRFSIQDAYTGASLFLSEELKNYDYWHQTGGDFSSGPETRLVKLGVLRVPDRAAIRGKLLVGNFRLSEKQQ